MHMPATSPVKSASNSINTVNQTSLAPSQFPGGPERSLEDLKERYYSVARKLLMAREANDALLTVNPLLRQPYNSAHERSRKAALLALQKRDPEREEQENAVSRAWFVGWTGTPVLASVLILVQACWVAACFVQSDKQAKCIRYCGLSSQEPAMACQPFRCLSVADLGAGS